MMEPRCKKVQIQLVRIKVEDIKEEYMKVEDVKEEEHDVEMREEDADRGRGQRPVIRVKEEDGTDIGFLIPVKVHGSESPRQPSQSADPSTVRLPVKTAINVKEEQWDHQVCAADVKLEPAQVKPEPAQVKLEPAQVKPESMESSVGLYSTPGIKEESEASSVTTADQQFWRKTQAAIDHEFSWDSETGSPVASSSHSVGPQRWAVEGSLLKPCETQQKRPQSHAGPHGKSKKSKKSRQEAALSPANQTLPSAQPRQREQRTDGSMRLAAVMDALSRQMSRFACDVTDQLTTISNRLAAMENTMTSLEA
ncbi:uncharacterized protein LOC134466390 [Engraulis encrasicolus]|uniref:uncharacterized protein LOC134466390 n=1 Tax=Engraulis encrasicolus TaxID=184585 RepID=UPI002FD352FF